MKTSLIRKDSSLIKDENDEEYHLYLNNKCSACEAFSSGNAPKYGGL